MDSCTPRYSQPGQVSSGTVTTLCCQRDLCNNKQLSSAAARPLLGATALALGLLTLTLTLAPSL